VTNAATTGTSTSISTGNGLSSGQALNVNTGSSTFTTGNTQDNLNATRGFFYGGGANSYAGATTFANTGDFTGTLVAMTADATTAGTVLGISAKNLTTGKAIDVSLGTLYSGQTDSVGGYTVGAVNVRAQSFTGNVFNVSASGAAASTGNLANLSTNQLAGTVLNVVGNSLTSGTAVKVSTTSLAAAGKAVSITVGTAGTPLYVNSATGYSGNLIDLQVNAGSKFAVDQSGTLTLAGNLVVNGGTITGPTSSALAIDNGSSAINIGGATTAAVNLSQSGQTTAIKGAATIAQTLGVTGDLTVGASKFVVTALTGNTAIAGDVNVNGKFQTAAATGNTIVGGTLSILGATITGPASGTFGIDGGFAGGALNIGTTANTGTITIGRSGQTQALAGDVTVAGTIVGGANISTTAGGITITGNSTIVGTLTSLTGLTSSGTITFSGLTTGLVYNTSGVLTQVGNGTAGEVLTSNGAGSAPTFQGLSASKVVLVTTTGTTTYTPTAGTLALYVECIGAGGGGGGASGNNSQTAWGGGGGAGAYSAVYVASPAASYSVTVGTGGTAGTTSGSTGGAGGDTTVGSTSICTGKGGGGGFGMIAGTALLVQAGGAGGQASGGVGDLTASGAPGTRGIRLSSTVGGSGEGGSTMFGGGGAAVVAASSGNPATSYGGGGGGGGSISNPGRTGGVGYQGIVRIIEYR